MSQSAEYCSDKKGDRGGGGGAVAHQRKMIRGLLVWATLLTLGLAVSLTLHFIHREPPAPDKLQDPGNTSQQSKVYMDKNLMIFSPKWEERHKVGRLQWKTLSDSFITGEEQLTVMDDGLYFLYLQVTLVSHMTENYTITVNSNQGTKVLLKGFIDKSKLSTGFMGVGISLNSKEILTVTCEPEAKILTSHTETYLGVIKLHSN